MLYFDHNATHPLSRVAREAWLDATERYIGNPSSPHRLGARADAALTQAREKLAGWLGCEPRDIVWTSGATEANNAALYSAAANGAKDIWISAIEHPCALAAAEQYFGKRRRSIPVTPQGVVDVEWLAKALEISTPGLVGIMAANNETGVLQPWREVQALCRAQGVPFFCDAAQWVGKLPAEGLGAGDFVSGCAHKFGGPQGVGFLKVPAKFRPLIVGGPQEDGRRAGTENVVGVLAMIAALEEREAALGTHGMAERLGWHEEFEQGLRAALPGISILGARVSRLWNTSAAIMPEQADCRQRWVVKLDKLGFAVSTGSACASGKEETSHVLAAMEVSADAASRALRFSSGWETTHKDWRRLLDGLRQAHAELTA
ncbi:MAG: cysteine desulfurase family protein [Chthoniobacter sp.]|uniref:cysteine desulfurase family protein n=1 Tax=Chthoniobacter sp. TaxID=2510640 RepID=UPI0032A17B06